MRDTWVTKALELSLEKADFYSGCRKILRTVDQVYEGDQILSDESLTLADCGFTKMKTTILTRNYYHEESIKIAVMLWNRRRSQRSYGSVGFTTYNHLIKVDPNKKSKRGSVMGPCIQSVTLTLIRSGVTAIDIFYRTTEYFKKFPADLVFIRDHLLPNFNFEGCPINHTTFHFANLTCHPMYFITLIPHIKDPIQELQTIHESDEYFWHWVVKWTARYLCEEYMHGIQKFSQAMRVRKNALKRINHRTVHELQLYLRENHPGYRKGKA